MSVVLHLVLAFATICIGSWWWYTSNKNKSFYKNIPGPPTLPFIGNALDLTSTSVLLDTLMRYIKQHGDLVKVRVGPGIKFLIVTDYKLLEFLLSTTKVLTKSEDYDFIKPWLGSGLLTGDGKIWKKHRKILVPAFHFQILEQFIEVFEQVGDKFVEKLSKVDETSIDIYPFVTLCSLDIICESIMGISIKAQDNDTSDYVQSVHHMCRIIIERSISLTQMYDSLYFFSKNYRTQTKALKLLHEKSNFVISQRRKELEEEKHDESADDGNIQKKKPFLDILLTARVDGEPLSQEEIREEVDTFMFEGHDTTASATSFTLYCLANNPQVQQKALEEQNIIFENSTNKTASYSDLQKMKYLELVIKETLRLYPSVPFIGRQTKQEVEFENAKLPQGDTMLLFIFGIHRNPKYFKDPDRFDPSRFETMDGSHPYAYIPFSAGPRNCIGQKFAMLEMKSIVSKVLREFALLPAIPQHELKLVAETVLKSSNGIKILLKKRN